MHFTVELEPLNGLIIKRTTVINDQCYCSTICGGTLQDMCTPMDRTHPLCIYEAIA
jgi:hypothetical protein